jgi:L-asparaginase II
VDVNPVLVEVERSGFVESRHRGAAVGLGDDGTAVVRAGEPGAPIFPRSANKPMQAVAMLRCGLDLDGELLALASGSHSGEDFHVEGVEKILAGSGLVAADLRCPESWPLDPETQQDVARTGGGPSRLRMNCSGKHAAMLATCVTAGWPTASYLDPDHPLQQAVRDVVEELAGEPVTAVGVDGCGAPLFAVSIEGVARAFRALVLAEPGTPQRRVADAMRTHPQWTSGTRREERQLMDALPGLLVKCGAEGVDAFAFTDGRAGAVKIDDGAMRARTPVTVALLRALGIHHGIDKLALDELATVQVRGGEAVVGAIRPAHDVFGR